MLKKEWKQGENEVLGTLSVSSPDVEACCEKPFEMFQNLVTGIAVLAKSDAEVADQCRDALFRGLQNIGMESILIVHKKSTLSTPEDTSYMNAYG